MKINYLDRFPHPVLEEATNDYLTGEFSLEIEIAESMKTGALSISYSVQLSEASLKELVNTGKAKVNLFITCLETYYNRLHEINLSGGKLEIAQGLLSGGVNLLPIVIAANEDISIANGNLHEDFKSMDFHPEIGDVLALGMQFQIEVGREKLAPIESIFEMAISDNVLRGQFQISLDEERITILAERETYNAIYDIRNTISGRTVLLNGMYLPVVMDVLSILQDDSGSYQDKRWYKVFSAKCMLEGIDIQNPDLLKDAQKLLKTPLTRAISMMQEVN